MLHLRGMTRDCSRFVTVLSLNATLTCVVNSARRIALLARSLCAAGARTRNQSSSELRPTVVTFVEKHGYCFRVCPRHQQHAMRCCIEPRSRVVRLLRPFEPAPMTEIHRRTIEIQQELLLVGDQREFLVRLHLREHRAHEIRCPIVRHSCAGAMKYENTMASEPSATGHAASGARSDANSEPGAAQHQVDIQRRGTAEIGRGRWPSRRTSRCTASAMANTAAAMKNRPPARSPRAARPRATAPIRGTAAPRAPARAAPAGYRRRACRGSPKRTPARCSTQKSGSHTRALRSWNAALKRGTSQNSSRLHGSHSAGITSTMK